ncbi:MAG: zf-HC2 domain-containing protein [Pirellulales bacterium]|nr:zf-HC2 domain-containing protein [Pirellulales bacterium]
MKELSQNELLSAYLDGELSADDCARVEQLLAEDAAARQTLDELRAVSASLKGLPAYRLDEDLGDRVLRAAEHRILTEPTRLADAPRPAASAPGETAGMRRLARRFFSPRAVVWSGLAVSVAILLTVLQSNPWVRESHLAKAPESVESAHAEAEISAFAEVPEEPADLEETTDLVNAKKGRGHLSSKSDSLSAHPRAPALALEPDFAHSVDKKAAGTTLPSRRGGRLHGTGDPAQVQAVLERRAERAGEAASPKKLGALKKEAEVRRFDLADDFGAIPEGSLAKPETHRKKAAISGKKDAALVDAVERDTSNESIPNNQWQMFGRVVPGSRFSLANSAVQRATQNQAGLLIVNCDITSEAARQRTFTKTLDSNRIDVVEVSPDDRHLARELVVNFTQVSPESVQRKPSRSTEDQPVDAKQALAFKPPAEPTPAKLSEKSEQELGRVRRELDDRLQQLPVNDAVEVVLVEGTDRQIATTLAELTRNNVAVSIVPQQAGRFGFARGNWHEALFDTENQATKAPPSTYFEGSQRRLDKQETTEGVKSRVTAEQPRPQRVLSSQTQEPKRPLSRGTAQQLGTIELGERSSATGLPLALPKPPAPSATPPSEQQPAESLAKTAPSQSTTKQDAAPSSSANDSRLARDEISQSRRAEPLVTLPPAAKSGGLVADHPVATKKIQPTTPQSSVADLPGPFPSSKDRGLAGKPQDVAGGGYGGMGGMGLEGASQWKHQADSKAPAQRTRDLKQKTQNESLANQRGATYHFVSPPSDKPESLRQVLFVLRRVPNGHVPPAAAASVDASTVEPPSQSTKAATKPNE